MSQISRWYKNRFEANRLEEIAAFNKLMMSKCHICKSPADGYIAEGAFVKAICEKCQGIDD